jgi:hypothetical protein
MSKWRMVIGFGIMFFAFEFVAGCTTYYSKVSNFTNTAVVTGWEAVWWVCGVYIPVSLLTAGLITVATLLIFNWADREN